MSDDAKSRDAARAFIESADAAFRAPRPMADDFQHMVDTIGSELRGLSNGIEAFNADLPGDDPSRIASPKGFVIAVRCSAEEVIAEALERRWVFPCSLNLVPDDHAISAGPGDVTAHAVSPDATGRGNPVVLHPVQVTRYRPALTDVVAVTVHDFSASIQIPCATPPETLTRLQILPSDASTSGGVRP